MRTNGTETHMPSASSSSGFLNADRSDLLVRGFWEKSTGTMIDVRVTNLDSKSYKEFFTQEGPGTTGERKEKKYCKPC